MNNKELLPCPFCGNENIIKMNDYSSGPNMPYVWCCQCGAKQPEYTGFGWNTRSPKVTTGLQWVSCNVIPEKPIPQYNARYWSRSLNEWIPDVIFLSTDDMIWKSCSDGLPVNNPVEYQYQYLSESSPLPSIEEVLKWVNNNIGEYANGYKEVSPNGKHEIGIILRTLREVKTFIESKS